MNEQARTIIDSNILGVLATVNEDGSPWATPLHIVADDGAMYWFSAPDRVHSANLARDNRASLALFSSDVSRGPHGVYVNGSVEQLDEAGRADAVKVYEQRLGPLPAHFQSASAYRLPLGDLDEQKSTGNCWYFYSR